MPKINELVEGYTFVARPSRKGQSPPHLIPYQARFRQVSQEAALETRHLKGERRVVAMNNLVRQKLRKEKT